MTETAEPLRIAYLSYSTGEFDARTFRMARSAVRAGHAVTVYARWHPGLAASEPRDGYRVVRVPYDWRMALPGLGSVVYRREMARMARTPVTGSSRSPRVRDAPGAEKAATASSSASSVRRVVRRPARWWRTVRKFPLLPLGWRSALERTAEPADIWHGMWAGSLPAALRMRRRHGGRAIYDSRDVFMRSREFERLGWPTRPLLRWIERRWARSVDRVVTVNEDYADILAGALGVRRPAIVMNCPERWTPPEPPPDLIRVATGIPEGIAVVLYQGQLASDRGLERSIEAILDVPGAALVLLGYGPLADRFAAMAEMEPYAGRLHVLPPVAPDALIPWTASADVSVMAIPPTSLNHRFTTPQKLFESLAAGVPVVASDLPGMARIVRSTGAGVLCDPASTSSIADAIRRVVLAPADERVRLRASALHAAHERYNWEAQLGSLFEVYAGLAPEPTAEGAADARL